MMHKIEKILLGEFNLDISAAPSTQLNLRMPPEYLQENAKGD